MIIAFADEETDTSLTLLYHCYFISAAIGPVI